MKASVLIMTLLLAVTFPLIACDDDNGGDTGITPPDAAALCDEGLCVEPGEERDACINLIQTCVADEPAANWDECVVAGLVQCGIVDPEFECEDCLDPEERALCEAAALLCADLPNTEECLAAAKLICEAEPV